MIFCLYFLMYVGTKIFFLIMISTPLILACEIGNVEIAELLLQNGAIIDMRGHKGRYVMSYFSYSRLSNVRIRFRSLNLLIFFSEHHWLLQLLKANILYWNCWLGLMQILIWKVSSQNVNRVLLHQKRLWTLIFLIGDQRRLDFRNFLLAVIIAFSEHWWWQDMRNT